MVGTPGGDGTPTASLEVRLGRLTLPNPVLVASGTFGYAKEMASFVDLHRLGGILPKTITWEPRPGNRPPRTVETPAGMLNAIGLDNDGIESFVTEKMAELRSIGVPIIVSVAGRTAEEYARLAERLDNVDGVSAIELNISCPNVSGGIDFGTNVATCEKLVAGVRKSCELPVFVKLTPNVTSIAEMAKSAEAGGADAVSLINTVLGMSVDWRRRRPRIGNGMGGLSGPAIRPIALRMVYQVSRAVKIPVIGIGGISTLDDAMEFFVTGATAIQVGTSNFFRPTSTMEILDGLPGALRSLGATRLSDVTGTLEMP
ncbi:MAG: dihydroorotate dehydrogenase [Planctomycetia bacterium]|nr:dihydroorotate dehydrogenase [Planctomycetia bacterium]